MACIKPPKLLSAGRPVVPVTAAFFESNHHVFDAIIEGSTLKGGHHLLAFDLSSVTEAVVDIATGNARYHMESADGLGTVQPKDNSMFDQGKSRQEIKQMIVDVVQNRDGKTTPVPNDPHAFEGESRGTRIRVVFANDFTLKTAYPIIPGPRNYRELGGRMELSHERTARQRRRQSPL